MQHQGQQPPYPQQPQGGPPGYPGPQQGQGYGPPPQSPPPYSQPYAQPYPQGGPQPGYAPPQQPVYGANYATAFPIIGGVKVPIMISGILNAISLLATPFWLMTIIFAWVPLLNLILMIFEFKMVASLNGRTPPSHHRGGATGIAICEIVSIIYGNVGSAICGIITLCNVGKMQP